MTKRLLNCFASDIAGYSVDQLLESIRMCEGRVLAAETINTKEPLLNDISNAEFVASMSADMIILNFFDAMNPVINGLDEADDSRKIRRLKELTGRIIGANLEPVNDVEKTDSFYKVTPGRVASKENALRCKEMGLDLLVITGNPGNGVSNAAIVSSVRTIRETLGRDIMIACGKLQSSGILSEMGENIITREDIDAFIDAGTDIVILPAPGTVPGIRIEYIHSLISHIHSREKLAMTSIGTSQEGADSETIRNIALNAKMAGADIHHIGDTGYVGMALPENIMNYSIAIRGVRHTYHRMASSPKR